MVNLDQVLELLNEARRACGWPPLAKIPGGSPGMSRECPIARALPGTIVLQTGVYFECMDVADAVALGWRRRAVHKAYTSGRKLWCVSLPDVLSQFVDEFDTRTIQSLVVPLRGPLPPLVLKMAAAARSARPEV